MGRSKIGPTIRRITPSRHRLNLQKNIKNPKFHFGFSGKIQNWTNNSTYYPFSPPAENPKKYKKITKFQSSTLDFQERSKIGPTIRRITPSRHRLKILKKSKKSKKSKVPL